MWFNIPLLTLLYSFHSLCFSLHSTTPHQPQVRALPPLPHPQHLLCLQMTVNAPHMSWPRSGCATGEGCRTARVWTKSAKHVAVNRNQASVYFCPCFSPSSSSTPYFILNQNDNYMRKKSDLKCFHVFHSWSWGPGRRPRRSVGGPTGHHLLCSGAGRDSQSRRRPD